MGLDWFAVPDGLLAGALLGLLFWVVEIRKAQDHWLDPGDGP